jgi:hypothetical protein
MGTPHAQNQPSPAANAANEIILNLLRYQFELKYPVGAAGYGVKAGPRQEEMRQRRKSGIASLASW